MVQNKYGTKFITYIGTEKEWINLLQPSIAYLYPLKTSEMFSGGNDKQHRTVMG